VDDVLYRHENHRAGRSAFGGQVLDRRQPLDRRTDPHRRMKAQASACPHAAWQIDGRQEAAALRMPIGADQRLACTRQEIEPVAKRRHLAVAPPGAVMIEQRCESGDGLGRCGLRRPLLAADPCPEMLDIHAPAFHIRSIAGPAPVAPALSIDGCQPALIR